MCPGIIRAMNRHQPERPIVKPDRSWLMLCDNRAALVFNMIIRLATKQIHNSNVLLAFWLPPDGFLMLLDGIASGAFAPMMRRFLDHELQYGYDPNKSLIMIRKPTKRDKSFVIRLARWIGLQLNQLAAKYPKIDAVQHFAFKAPARIHEAPFYMRTSNGRSVVLSTHPAVNPNVNPVAAGYTSPSAMRSPDMCFFYTGPHGSSDYPFMVVEVVSAGMVGDLPDLAQWYVKASKGVTNIVLGVDAEHAALSMWKAAGSVEAGTEDALHAECVVDGIPFSCSGSGLQLVLADMLPKEVLDGLSGKKGLECKNAEIRLTFLQLADMLMQSK